MIHCIRPLSLLVVCTVTLGLCACSQQKVPKQVATLDGENPLLGRWLQETTVFHYAENEDRVEIPSDSTWFLFSENGTAIFTQRINAAYHQQLYTWATQDSTLNLSSDIQLNTGEFFFKTSDSTFSYTRQLPEESIEGLTGWTYHYIRIEGDNPVAHAK